MKKIIFIVILLLATAAHTQMLSNLRLIRESSQQQSNFNPSKSDTLIALDSVWNNWVNRACIRTAADLACIERTTTVTTTSGTRTYGIDTAIIDNSDTWVVRYHDKVTKPLKQIPIEFMQEFNIDTSYGQAGSPQVYMFFGDSITFFPIPTKAETYMVGYAIYPKYMDDDTVTTNIPLEYREFSVFYTCFLYASEIRDYKQAQYWKTLYDGSIAAVVTTKKAKYDILSK